MSVLDNVFQEFFGAKDVAVCVLPVHSLRQQETFQRPDIVALSLTRGSKVSDSGLSEENSIAALIDSVRNLDNETVGRIKNWLKVRLNADSVDIIVSVVEE